MSSKTLTVRRRPHGMPTVEGIRRLYGTGHNAYRDAKLDFFDKNPLATQAEIDDAMRIIAKACKV